MIELVDQLALGIFEISIVFEAFILWDKQHFFYALPCCDFNAVR